MSSRNIRPASAGQAGWRLLGTLRRSRAGLLCGTALQAAALSVVALPAAAQPAPNARPTGGTVVAGAASIATSATATTVTQATQRAAVDWRSFDVGSQQSVVFAQPSSSAITLNRVNSPNPSAIAGKITANGSLVLVNQSGVVFFPGAQVNAQAAVISAAGISNDHFMHDPAGHLVFDQAATPGASVENRGTITVREAGLAALVAPRVANSGVINARLGHVVLAGAEAATLDMYGDGLVSIDVTRQVSTTPKGGTALVTNTGTVLADGGTVQITAAAADGVVQTLVSAGGRIQADSVGGRTGTIVIDGTGGALVVEGAVRARGLAAGSTGGDIELAASGSVTLAPGARVNASGKAGGGTVALGTTLARAKGGAGVTPSLTASSVTIAKGAKIAADAKTSGPGGKVTVLATGSTNFAGHITARGGTAGGDGGAVEISGDVVALTGAVDVSARGGSAWHTGSILLDPVDLLIATGGTAAASGTVDFASGVTTLDPANLHALAGNITLQASNNLTVSSAIALTTVGQSLTLDAGNNLLVNAALNTHGDVALIAGDSASPTPVAAGSITVSAGINTNGGGALSLTTNTGGVSLTGLQTVNGVTVNVGGAITQVAGAGNVVTATTLSGSAGSLSLLGSNAIGTLGTLSATSGMAISNAQSLTVAGVLTAPTISLTTTAGALTLAGTLGNGASASTLVALGAATAINQTGGLINATTLTANAGTVDATNTVALTSATNTIGTLTGSSAHGTFTLADAGPLTAAGTIAAPTLSLSSTGSLTLAGTLGNGAAASTSVALSGSSISQTGGLINATTLTASAGTGDASLAVAGNTIGTLGASSAAGSFKLADSTPLTVTGTVGAGAAQTLTLLDDAPTVTGATLRAHLGTIVLAPLTAGQAISVGGAGGYGSGASFDANVLQLGLPGATGTGAITVAGALNPGATVTTLLLDSSGAINEAAGLVITVPTLGGSAGGTVALAGTSNAISTLAGFASVGGFSLADAGTLTVAGSLSDTVSIGLTSTGQLTAGGTLTAPTIDLTSTGGRLALSGTLGNGLSASTSIALSGTDINQTGGVLNTATLTATTTGGDANITSIGNTIGTVTASSAVGVFNLTDSTPLTVVGTFAVGSGQTLTVIDDSLTVTGATLRAHLGKIVLAPLTDGHAISVGAGGYGSGATFDANVLQLGQPGAGGTGAITVAGALNPGPTVTTLLLDSDGAINEAAGLVITVPTLGGSAGGTVSLAGTLNAISTLAGFSSVGGFSLADAGTLTVAGSLSDTVSIGLTSTGLLTAGGTLAAPRIALTSSGDGVTLTGTLGDGASASTLLALNAATAIDQTGGLINATTLTANAGTLATTDTVSLTSVTNTIATLTGSSADGAFSLVDAAALTAAGTIAAPTLSLSSTGALTLTGTLSASTSMALSGSSISQTGGLLNAATLTATAGTGDATITATGNTVGTLTASSAAGVFKLEDSTPLTVVGTVAAGSGQTLTLLDDSLTVTGATLKAHLGTIVLAPLTAGHAISVGAGGYGSGATFDANVLQFGLPASTGAITVAGALNPGPTVTTLLLDSGGAINEAAGVIITVPTLGGSAGGTVSLAGTLNAISTLAGFASVGGFSLADAGTLTVAGSLTDTASIGLTSTGLLTAGGTLAAPTIDLTSSGGALSLGGTLGNGAAASTLVALSAATAINQTGGLINATTLTANAGTLAATDTVSLTSATNTVATLTGSSADGAFTLVDAAALTAAGTITAPTLSLSSTGALTLAGTLAASTSMALSGASISQTGGLLNTATLTATAGTGDATIAATGNTVGTLTASSAAGVFELADSTPLTVLGTVAAGSGQTLTLLDDSLTATGATLRAHTGTIVLAPLTANQAITVGAGGYAGGATFDANVLQLGLPGAGGTGAITVGGALNVGPTVTTLLLDSSAGITEGAGLVITVPTLGGSAGGTVALAGTLNAISTLAGFSSVGGFALADAGTLTVAGSLSDTASIGLTSTGLLTAGGTLAAPSIALTSTGDGVSLTGTLGDGASASTLVALAAATAISQTGGVINAATLTANAGTVDATDTVSLISAANTIGTLTGASAAGAFTLVDAGALTAAGTITAPTLSLTSTGTLTLTGTLAASASLALGGSSISQTGGLLDTATLTATAGAGDAILGATGNGVGTLTASSAAGAFKLEDSTPLTVVGTVAAGSGQTLTLLDDSLTVTGATLRAHLGTIVLAPLTAGQAVSVGAGGYGSGATFDATTLQLGLPGVGGTGAITVGGALNPGPTVTTLLLDSGAGITEAVGVVITVPTLGISAGGAVSLGNAGAPNANLIGTLAGATSSGGFLLQNAQTLAVQGPVSDSTSIALAVTGGDLDLSGNPAGIATAATGTLILSASGNIIEGAGGVLDAIALSGSAGGSADLTAGANSIATLGSFTSSTGFALADGETLTVGGPVSDPTSISVHVTSGDLLVQGTLSAGGELTLAAAGSIAENAAGALTAATLTGTAGGSASLTAGLNDIATLGSFSSSTGFALLNAGTLTIGGPVTDGVSVSLSNAGPVTLDGTITAPVIGVTASTLALGDASSGSITQTGGLLDATGTLTLTASGAIAQTAGTIDAATLTGSAGGGATLDQFANAIGTLAGFRADTTAATPAGFVLADGQALTVTGSLTDPLSILLTTSGSLVLAGVISAPAVTLDAPGTITQPGGSILAGDLTGSGAAATLDSAANQIGTLSDFAAPGGFQLTDATAVTVAGTVSTTGPAGIRLRDDGVILAAAGSLTAGTGSVALAPFAAGDVMSVTGNGGLVTAGRLILGGGLDGVAQAGSLGLSGSFNLAGIDTLQLLATAGFGSTGGITQTGAILMPSGTLIGSAVAASLLGNGAFSGSGASATLTGVTNQFGTLGDFTASGGGFALASTGAQGLTIAGTLDASGAVQLGAIGGAISETTGAIHAATLTGWSDRGAQFLSSGNLVGTLAGFTADRVAGAGFALADAEALTVTGVVSDPAGILLHTTSGDLRVQGVLAGATSLASGWQPTATLTLDSAGGIIETAAGTLAASTLTGAAAGSVALATGLNSIATLGSFASSGGFTLANQGSLTVAGPVADTAAVSLTSAGPIVLAGDITAPVIGVTASSGGITQTGGLVDATGVGGSLTLTATGAILQSGGTLEAVTLTGSAGGSVGLTLATNNISTLAGFTSGGSLTLDDQADLLTVTGAVQAPLAISLTNSNGIDLNAATLDGSTVALAGASGITQEGGAIIADTLTGSSAFGSVTLDSTANRITELDSFSTRQAFWLTDAVPLSIVGDAGGATTTSIRLRDDSITFAAGGFLSAPAGTIALAPYAVGDAMTVTGADGVAVLVQAAELIAGGNVDGTAQAGSLTLAGTLNLVSATVLDLLASGDITQTGTLRQPSGTLIGSGANVALTGSGNAFGTLGGFTAGGAFALTNTGEGLTVAGRVQAGGSIALDVTGGGITLGGASAATLSTPTLVSLTTDGAITEPNGAIDAATLTLSAASATLGGGNSVTTLAGATAPGGLTLNDVTGLTIDQPVNAGPVALTVSGDLTLAAIVTAPSVSVSVSGAVVQSAGSLVTTTLSGRAASMTLGDVNSIATLGPLAIAGGLVLDNAPDLTLAGGLTAGAVQITDAGSVVLAGDVSAATVHIDATGSLAQTAGTLSTGALSGSAASVSLPDANPIASVGDLTSGGAVLLAASQDLALTGALTAGGPVDLIVAGTLSEGGVGHVDAPSLVDTAARAILDGPNKIPSVIGFTAPDGLVFTDFIDLGIGGPVGASTVVFDIHGDLTLAGILSAAAVRLNATGAITQPAGVLVTSTLSGSAASVSLGQGNSIATLADFTTPGGFALTTTGPLDVVGPITAGSVSLTTGGALSLDGNVTAGSLAVNVAGSVVQGGGLLALGTLSGSAVALAQFGPDDAGPVASVGTLGPFTVSGAGSQLYIANSQGLVLAPPISAGAISISAPGAITLAAGTLSTGGVPTIAPPPPVSVVTQTGTVHVSGSVIRVTGDGGQFTQTGTTLVNPAPGQGSGTLIIEVSGGGRINLGSLSGPAIDLVLVSGAGTISGAVDVGALTVAGSGGSSNLVGTVGGFGGKVAAKVAHISPTATKNYEINACPLQSVNCLVLSVQAVPIPSVISDLQIGNVTDNPQDPDLLLPDIAARDY